MYKTNQAQTYPLHNKLQHFQSTKEGLALKMFVDGSV